MTDHLLSRGRGSRRLPLVNPHTVVLNLNSVLAVFPHAANGPTRLEEDLGFCVGRARPASFRNSQAVNNDEEFVSSLSELYLDLFHCHVGLHKLTAGAVGRTSQDRTASNRAPTEKTLNLGARRSAENALELSSVLDQHVYFFLFGRHMRIAKYLFVQLRFLWKRNRPIEFVVKLESGKRSA